MIIMVLAIGNNLMFICWLIYRVFFNLHVIYMLYLLPHVAAFLDKQRM